MKNIKTLYGLFFCHKKNKKKGISQKIENLDKIAIAEELVVGTTSGYAPYVSINAEGEYEGFDIDIAKALAEKLGRRLVIKDFGSMPSLILALKQNKADALIWSISITQERQKQMAMVYYQGEKVTSLPLLFWGNIPDNIKSLEDMANKPNAVIGVKAGPALAVLFINTLVFFHIVKSQCNYRLHQKPFFCMEFSCDDYTLQKASITRSTFFLPA